MDAKDGVEDTFHQGEDPNDTYELLQLLGEGSYGSVYKGVHKELRTTAAIKIVNYGNKASVTAEIEFLRRLKCDYVVSYIDGYLFDGELWILMEFCAGGSLSDLRDITKKDLNEVSVRAVVASCILGLDHLHKLDSIHRDIKAGNILLTHDGKAKLADFGVSAQLINTAKSRKTMIGTPFWMAPELIQETSYNGKADVWSLGITILELVEGNPPHFNVHPMRAIFMIPMKDAPTLKEPEKWSPQMQSFVKQCLVKDMLKRSDAATLLNHAWITGDVAVVREGHGVQVLRDLVADNWDAIEASRVNQNDPPVDDDDAIDAMESKDTDNDTDSDKTATLVESDKAATLKFSASTTPPTTTTFESPATRGTSRSTYNKNARPCSKRIKRHATNSKSTTGEARNTSSSQLGTFQRLSTSNDDFASTGTFVRSSTSPVDRDGTLKAGVLQTAYDDADDGTSTLKLNANTLAKASNKVTRFDAQSYFHDNNLSHNSVDPALVFDLILLLGEGSYGRVYKGMHKFEKREVAIKIIPCDNQSDITTEIHFLSKVKCPYIVSFVDGFYFDEELWIVMEYCAGGSLSDLRDITRVSLSEAQVKLVVCYAVLGLKHLHSMQCIHRDIKAGNILLTIDGIPKLADFGVSATELVGTLNKRKTVIGTPFWMAPEVIQEQGYDSKADIWSLGITVIELCEGKPPHFEVHPMRAIFLIPNKPPPKLKEPHKWSPEMAHFVCNCLVKDPKVRSSAEDLSQHPWIVALAKDVEAGKHPTDMKKLVMDNIETIYKVRESRRSSKHMLQMPKRPSVDNEYYANESVDGVDGEDAASVATMELGRASRETSLNSEKTAPIQFSGDSEDAAAGTFVVVKKSSPSYVDIEPVSKAPTPDEDDDTWFNVDTLKGSLLEANATMLSMVAESPLSAINSDDEEDASGSYKSHKTPEQQSFEEPAASNFSAARQNFRDLTSKQEIYRQLAALDLQYKADKEKLYAKYQMNRNKLKLQLASFN